jgi:hypothetical protein
VAAWRWLQQPPLHLRGLVYPAALAAAALAAALAAAALAALVLAALAAAAAALAAAAAAVAVAAGLATPPDWRHRRRSAQACGAGDMFACCGSANTRKQAKRPLMTSRHTGAGRARTIRELFRPRTMARMTRINDIEDIVNVPRRQPFPRLRDTHWSRLR